MIRGLQLDTVVDESAQIHTTIPVLPQLPALNDALRDAAATEVSHYQADPGTPEDFNLSWQLVGVSDQVVGVLLRTVRTRSDVQRREVMVSWFDRSAKRILAADELFSPQGWAALSTQLSRDLCVSRQRGSVAPPIQQVATEGHLAVAFAGDGGLVVMEENQNRRTTSTLAVIDAENARGWLSAAGQHARVAAVAPQALVVPKTAESAPPTPSRSAKPLRSAKPSPTTVPENKRSAQRSAKLKTDCHRSKCVALTFDDGPGEDTNRLLTILGKAHAPATFFMMGQHVDAYPQEAKRAAAEGFEIGNHSYTHPDLTRRTTGEVDHELTQTAAAITKATGHRPVLFRPPYGAHDARIDRAAARNGLSVVLWDVDPLDWKYRDPTTVRRSVMAGVRAGSIVLMHDIRPTTVDAVPKLIKQLRRDGYILVTVGELLGSVTPGSVHARAR